MKRLLIYAGLLFSVSLVLSSCYKDVILPAVVTTKPPQYVSFSGDLQPIFTTNCALSGCHVKGSQVPYLSADLSYQQLLGGFVNTIKPDQSEIYIQINGNMQVHIPNADDRQKIYDWIRNGAPNN
jgi:hypothetical protein